MSEPNASSADVVKLQAEELLQEATGKKLLTASDIDIATRFGKMTPAAKIELYVGRLTAQICGERDRLLNERRDINFEYQRLRESDKELFALKKSLARDRWEIAITVTAMAIGGSLISAYPSGATKGAFGFAPESLFGLGWALISLGAAWQVGKTFIVTIVDHFTSSPRGKMPSNP